MADLESLYPWREAVEDGSLLDVSDVVSGLGLNIPVGLSRAVFHHPVIGGRWSDAGRLLALLSYELEVGSRNSPFEMTVTVILDKPGEHLTSVIDTRVVAQPWGGCGVRAAVLEASERLDSRRGRRGGPFYVV